MQRRHTERMIMKHKYILLKGIQAREVDLKYGLDMTASWSSSSSSADTTTPVNKLGDPSSTIMNGKETTEVVVPPRTRISELTKAFLQDGRKQTDNFVFLDEARKDHLHIVSMKNMVNEWLPRTTDLCCFWCRHPFSTTPIGCPIQYVPQRLEKKIQCDHKDDVVIRENISKATFKTIESHIDHSFINQECYFRVDGVFCSFPCCLAFIQDGGQKDNGLYAQSRCLLSLMHRQCFPESSSSSTIISPAPSWRLLKCYGGDMDIQQFRASFQNTDYVDHCQHMTRLPNQKMTGFLFEAKIKL